VAEVLTDGENGHLVDFFDIEGLADRITDALQAKDEQQSIRAAARRTVIATYDLKRVCLPAYLSLLQRITGRQVS
jgi:glycosyltransferase involved in cell wall biosynthesis